MNQRAWSKAIRRGGAPVPTLISRAPARPPAGVPCRARTRARRSRQAARRAVAAFIAELPRARRQRVHRGDEDLGAVRVVAEHVRLAQAGLSSTVAGVRTFETPAHPRPPGCRGAAAAGSSPSACSMRGASRPMVATARAWRAMERGERREVLALPSPPRMTAKRPRALSAPTFGRRAAPATVAPTFDALAVVEGIDTAHRGHRPTRCGSPRCSRRPHAAWARAAARWPWPAPAQPAHWRRCGRRTDSERVGRHQALDVQALLPRQFGASSPPSHAPARPCRSQFDQAPVAGARRLSRQAEADRVAFDPDGARPFCGMRFRHHRLDRGIVAVDRHHRHPCRRCAPSPRCRRPSSRASRDGPGDVGHRGGIGSKPGRRRAGSWSSITHTSGSRLAALPRRAAGIRPRPGPAASVRYCRPSPRGARRARLRAVSGGGGLAVGAGDGQQPGRSRPHAR